MANIIPLITEYDPLSDAHCVKRIHSVEGICTIPGCTIHAHTIHAQMLPADDVASHITWFNPYANQLYLSSNDTESSYVQNNK